MKTIDIYSAISGRYLATRFELSNQPEYTREEIATYYDTRQVKTQTNPSKKMGLEQVILGETIPLPKLR